MHMQYASHTYTGKGIRISDTYAYAFYITYTFESLQPQKPNSFAFAFALMMKDEMQILPDLASLSLLSYTFESEPKRNSKGKIKGVYTKML